MNQPHSFIRHDAAAPADSDLAQSIAQPIAQSIDQPIKVIGRAERDGLLPPLRLISMLTPQRVELRQPEVIVGRHSNADLQLLQPDISRHHCRIYYAGDQWRIGDLGSLNGISINHEKVESGVLRANDLVGIATHLFRVVLESDTPAAQPVDRATQMLRDIVEALPDEPGTYRTTQRRSA